MAEYAVPILSDPSIYERNFNRLLTLLPTLAQACASPAPVLPGPEEAGLDLEILECHKFTLVVRISQPLPLPTGPASTTSMTIRIYFDAQVAEVLAYQHHRRFQPKYDYPNVDMLHVREKRRVNEFLGEWLESRLARRQRLLVSA